jgi:hypothetical protein
MLRSLKELLAYTLLAEDGEIGRCRDFLFDDRHWTVRYMVADTGKWLPGRKVLVSPIAMGEPSWVEKKIPVRLTREDIENSPPLDEDAPVSRQYEQKYFGYFRWPYYWAGGNVWGPFSYLPPLSEYIQIKPEEEESDPAESHLRSLKEVTGYQIRTEDGEVGYVEDFIAEQGVWSIRYMIADTKKWLRGRKVLISPGWIDAIDWIDKQVNVNLTVEAIKQGPEYDPSEPVNREYEMRLYDYYGRPHYWKE